MTAVNVVQPTRYALVTRERLGKAYESVCTSIRLHPTNDGYGFLMGIRPDGARVTLVASHPSIVRDIVDMPRDGRDGLAVPDGGFPWQHDGWLDLPETAIVATVGRLAVFGRPTYSLGPTRPVHSITYLDNGFEVDRGYARGDELDVWRRDLTADGWVVDDREALQAPAAEQ